MSKLKVLHVGEYVQGGVATYLRILFSSHNVENYIIMSGVKSDFELGLPQSRVFKYHNKSGIKGIFSSMRAVHRKIKELQPDIVYCHSTWAGLITRAPMLLLGQSCIVIYNAHGWAFLRDDALWKRRIYALVEQSLSKVTNGIINVSKYELEGARQFGLDVSLLTCIYSGVEEVDKTKIVPIILPDNRINLLFVGRFDRPKGADYLLKEYLRISRKDLHLYLIGAPVVSDGEELRFNNDENVTLLGWLPYREVVRYYMACDAVVIPSRWEAFGFVAVEAMQCGTPVIASSRGALPEIVQNGVNGYIFNMDEKDGLKNCLSGLSKATLRSMSLDVETGFRSRFTAERMIRETENYLAIRSNACENLF